MRHSNGPSSIGEAIIERCQRQTTALTGSKVNCVRKPQAMTDLANKGNGIFNVCRCYRQRAGQISCPHIKGFKNCRRVGYCQLPHVASAGNR